MSIIIKVILIGIGATLLVDIWSFVQGLFGIKSLDYRYVGRWLGYFPKGKFLHNNIMKATPVKGELLIGWTAHYLIGITFACLLVLLYGEEWIRNPLIIPAFVIGIITLAAPLFIMQPAMGFGIASSNLPSPNLRRLKSLLTHVVYGLGLYLTSLIINQLWN